jgi:hypothetical protein
MNGTEMPSLAELLDAEERSWLPHKDDEQPRRVVGVVVKTFTAPSDYGDGDKPGVVLYDIDAGEGVCWRITGYHSVLDKELREQRPRVGDTVGVRYDGKRQGGGRGDYESYRVVVQRSTTVAPEINWSTVEAQRDADVDRGSGGDDESF